MNDEIVIDEGISRYGLARIHVIRMGEPVDVEKWVHERVNGGVVATFLRYEEEDLGCHHLRLWWWPEGQEAVDE